MADYYPLIARAVAGLDKNTGDARRALYERARGALVAQLRGVTPALSESDVTRERLALEEAIRKVEGESARKAWVEPARAEPATKVRAPDPSRWEEAGRWQEPEFVPEQPPLTPPPPPLIRRPSPPGPRAEAAARRQSAGAATAAASEARAPAQRHDRYVDPVFDQPVPGEGDPIPPLRPARPRMPPTERRAVSEAGLRDFRGVVSEASDLDEALEKAAKSARDDASPDPVQDHGQDLRMLEPQEHQVFDHYQPDEMLESSYAEDETHGSMQPRPRTASAAAAEGEGRASSRSLRGYIKIAAAAAVVLVLGGLLAWLWPNAAALYSSLRTPATSEAARETPAPPAQPPQRKFSDRIEPGGQANEAPGGAALTPGAAAVAQRVVLYEEDPPNPQAKRYAGSAIWRTEMVSSGAGRSPELAVRADIEIPERGITMTWTLRRNTDPGLPASHTVEIMFKLPPDFAPGGIANVPGMLMKPGEETRGIPVAGMAVKVTNGYFLIGLSAVDADKERNIQLLKERAWFDIMLVYNNNRRAILAIEKGNPGEQAFKQAFAAWDKAGG